MPPPLTTLAGRSASLAGRAISMGDYNRAVASVAGGVLAGRGALIRRGAGAQVFQGTSLLTDRRGVFGVGLTVQGVEEASRYLEGVRAAVARAAAARVEVRSDEPYAYGIQFGRHRGGTLARRKGGTYSFLGALLAVYPEVAPRLRDAIETGDPANVDREMALMGRRLLSETRSREVALSGRLRRSYYAIVPRDNNPRIVRRGVRLRRSP